MKISHVILLFLLSIFFILLLLLILKLGLSKPKTILPQPEVPRIAAWDKPVSIGECKLYDFPTTATSAPMPTLNKNVLDNKQGNPDLNIGCIYPNQIIAQPAMRTCIWSFPDIPIPEGAGCLRNDGSIASVNDTEELYIECPISSCGTSTTMIGINYYSTNCSTVPNAICLSSMQNSFCQLDDTNQHFETKTNQGKLSIYSRSLKNYLIVDNSFVTFDSISNPFIWWLVPAIGNHPPSLLYVGNLTVPSKQSEYLNFIQANNLFALSNTFNGLASYLNAPYSETAIQFIPLNSYFVIRNSPACPCPNCIPS